MAERKEVPSPSQAVSADTPAVAAAGLPPPLRRVWRAPAAVRYGVAVAVAVTTTALRLVLDPVWGQKFPLILFYPAVMVSAWFGGLWPGLATTMLCALAGAYFWASPADSPAAAQWTDALALLTFVAIGVLMSGLNEAWRRAVTAAASSEDRIRQLHDQEHAARGEAEMAAEQLRLALESGGMGTWEFTIGTGAVKWSPGLEAIHGYTPGGFRETFQAFADAIHPDDRQAVLDAVRAAVEGRRDYDVLYRILRPYGVVRWLEARGQLFRDGEGRPVRMVGISQDVTERKHSEEKFHLAVEAAPAAMLMVDERGRIVLANALTEQILGYTRAELMGKGIESLVPPRFRERHPEYRAAFVADPRPRPMGAGRELYAVRKDGSEVPVEIGLSPLDTAAGRFVLAAVTDISQRKEAERALQEADQRKDEFLAMLSHELRNPLGAITNAAQLVKQLAPPDGHLRWARDVIDRQAAHLARLVEDLLDVSRISRGQIVLQTDAIPVGSAVALARETARPLIEARRQKLTSTIPAAPIWVDGDATRLAQVIGNLLSNASRYTAQGGAISLTVEREAAAVLIRVRDTGIGISAEMLSRVFDLFVQAEGFPRRTPGGLGLGLTLARRLTELHGGRLEASSAGLGHGSEFTVRLPILAGKPAAKASTRPVTVYQAVRRRILVVDDNTDSAETFALALEMMGHEVRLAADGPSALEAVKEFRPQLVLLDIGLPGMDGYEVARRLRTERAFRGVLVAVTGYGQEEDRRRARDAGFDHHLVKPVTPDALLATLYPPPPSSGPPPGLDRREGN